MKNKIYKYIIFNYLLTQYIVAGVTSINNNVPQAITDNSCFNKIFNMPISTLITDITMEINIDHTWRADLDITLQSPAGTIVNLTSDNGGSRNNLYVFFDDLASTSITADTTTHTVTVNRNPEQPLSAFDGENAQGNWTLQICDDAGGDTGTYNYARLDINDTVVTITEGLQVEYREDECYWLGSSQVDIIESKNANNAIAMNGASTIAKNTTANYAGLCRAGDFTGNNYADVDVAFTLGSTWTLSTWIEFPVSNSGQQYHILGSYTGVGDLPVLDYASFPNIRWAIYDNSGAYTVADFNDTLTGWHQLTFVNTAGNTTLYLDGTLHSSIGSSTSGDVTVLNTSTDGFSTQTLGANTDELKIWGRTLSAEEISNLYADEKAGNTFDGAPRVCKTCDANATAGIWGLIGIPADFRTTTNKDVADVFDEFPSGSYNVPGNVDGWVVFKRDYNGVSNASSYSVVPYTGLGLEFGQGYWLITKVDVAWNENGLNNVDYNSTNPNCVTSPCVEIDMTPVTLNFGAPDNDTNDGSGKNRNNMLGFAGHTPVDWADCRILVDGTSYTPSGAETAGYMDKQIWQYNPGASGANANGYTTCDDITPGGCKLEPYKGFWVILHGTTKNKTVKLLIPKE